jgi:hypothetical protein
VFDHILLNSAEAELGRVWPRLAAFDRVWPRLAAFGRVWPCGVLFEWPEPLIAQPCAARGRAGEGCEATDVGLLCSRERGVAYSWGQQGRSPLRPEAAGRGCGGLGILSHYCDGGCAAEFKAPQP